MRLRLPLFFAAAAVLLSACEPLVPLSDDSAETQPTSASPVSPTSEPSSDATAERPLAAIVNGEPIYVVDYERQVSQYQRAFASEIDFASADGQAMLLQAREQILNFMIEQVLTEQYAARHGIAVTDEDVQAAIEQMIEDAGGEEAFQALLDQEGLTEEEMRQNLRAALIGTSVVEYVTGAVPETAEHVHARHVLVDTRDEAERLLAQLEAGADFAELAATYSRDEPTRQTSGDLGWFPRGVLMAPELEDAAFALQPGELSGVVESSFGFHIVQVIEREPDRPLSAENLELLRDLAFQEWLEALWAEADIVRLIDPAP